MLIGQLAINLALFSLLECYWFLKSIVKGIGVFQVEEAVAFTQSIVEKVDDHPEMEKEMQKAFAMIAFEKPEDSPYTYLLEISHRQMVCLKHGS